MNEKHTISLPCPAVLRSSNGFSTTVFVQNVITEEYDFTAPGIFQVDKAGVIRDTTLDKVETRGTILGNETDLNVNKHRFCLEISLDNDYIIKIPNCYIQNIVISNSKVGWSQHHVEFTGGMPIRCRKDKFYPTNYNSNEFLPSIEPLLKPKKDIKKEFKRTRTQFILAAIEEGQ